MMDQLQMFANYIRKLHDIVGRKETDNILSNSLFLVATGSDDLVDNYFLYPIRRIRYDIPSYASYLVSKASAFIKVIYMTRYTMQIHLHMYFCPVYSHTLTMFSVSSSTN